MHVPYVLAMTQKAASQLKMGKGGMHNPVSCNFAINPHYNFAAIYNV